MKLNKRGSILQITLVIFLTMIFSLTLCLSLIRGESIQNQMIDTMMKQKNLEIMLVYYYTYQVENDMLFSDYYSDDDYDISYTVDHMGEYYEIETTINGKLMNYRFIVCIDIESSQVLKFEYKEIGL